MFCRIIAESLCRSSISAVESEYFSINRDVEKEILPLTKELNITLVSLFHHWVEDW